MGFPKMDPDELRALLQKAHSKGLAKVGNYGGKRVPGRVRLADVARALEIPPSRLHRALYQHARAMGWDPMRPDTWTTPAAATPLSDKERARYTERISKLQDDLRRAYRQANAAEDLRQVVFGLASAPIVPPTIDAPRAPKGQAPAVPLLFASDFQWSERISAAQLDGVNEFNLQVARDRYALLIRTAREICRFHVGKPRAKSVIYARGGDMISGGIHDDLRETNAAPVAAQLVDLVEHEAAGIRALREDFEVVWVISVPGNHGRPTEKPRSKNYAPMSFDTLAAWMLEREFRDDPGVRFHTPASGDALFEVCGWKFCLTHGDRIGSRGGQGFIGPAATIARGMKKNLDYWARLGVPIDYQLVGHFHTSLELELGFSNGSLPGISEYARDFRMTPARASQWLLFVHPRHGVASRWPIYLSPPVRASRAEGAFEFLRTA